LQKSNLRKVFIIYNVVMDAEVARQLIALNKEFYQNLAVPFSATRARLQPGVKRILSNAPLDANILDLGCGNGGVARELGRGGQKGRYVGVDFSEELLEEARKNVQRPTSNVGKSAGLNVKFVQADLTSNDWSSHILDGQFDFIFAFAVLHHLPSREIRLGFLKQVLGLLASPTAGGSETRPYSPGRFVHANWQFLNSPKLRARIQPWEGIGLSDNQVDKGDYLLDWRSGGQGLRYVHHFDAHELAELAAETGFQVADSFVSDGKSGDLALYQTWEKL
jgi:tRNA (uracil-5-)-methyltransferase TRM9